MAKRTTIKVAIVTEIANRLLAFSTKTQAFREGVAALLEAILSETDNYNGFAYLRQHQVTDDQLPGIIFDETPARNHQYPDATRRKYSCKSK